MMMMHSLCLCVPGCVYACGYECVVRSQTVADKLGERTGRAPNGWCVSTQTCAAHRYAAPLYVDVTKTVRSLGVDGEQIAEEPEEYPKVYIGEVSLPGMQPCMHMLSPPVAFTCINLVTACT